MKVYCKTCKYLTTSFDCSNPKNIRDTWYSTSDDVSAKNIADNALSTPQSLNRNNDCTWYEKK